jgi:hypothetical protein
MRWEKVWLAITKVTFALCLRGHDLLKVGVNDIFFCLKHVLSECKPHIGNTLVGH